MIEIKKDAADFDGDDLVIRGNGCSGRGRRCVLYGNRIDIDDADGAIVYGHHCELWCTNPASITVYGHNTWINDKRVQEQPLPRTAKSRPQTLPRVVIDDNSVTVTRERERDRDARRASPKACPGTP